MTSAFFLFLAIHKHQGLPKLRFFWLLPLFHSLMAVNYIISFNDNATPQQIKDLKAFIADKGGVISTEYTIIPAVAVHQVCDELSECLQKQALHKKAVFVIEKDQDMHVLDHVQ